MSATTDNYELDLDLFGGGPATAAPSSPGDGSLDLDALADVLRRTDQLEPVDVALGIAAAGVPVLPVVPRGKDPLLAKDHVTDCSACSTAGLHASADHGATRDPDTIRRLWSTHPDTGVGMKNHPQLIRVDRDHADADALKKYQRKVRAPGDPWPFEAHTPGGQYRRRNVYHVADGANLAGGGTPALGVSWYQSSGYVVVKGTHPNGKPYPPFTGDSITPLPQAVRTALEQRVSNLSGNGTAERAAPSATVQKFHAEHNGMSRPHLLRPRVHAVERAVEDTRHRTGITQKAMAYADAVAGFYPSAAATAAIRDALRVAGWDDTRLGAEFDDLERWAVAQVIARPADEVRREAEQRLRDAQLARMVEEPEPVDYVADLTVDQLDALVRDAVSTPRTDDGTDTDDPLDHPRIATGGTFVYDVPDTLPALWGTGEQILWAQGEGLLIAGPTGTGKSTIAAQVVAARLGLLDTLLGHPITPDDRPVLYIAMDRPAQLQRLLGRLFRHLDADRRLLDERLIVWRGPLPALLNTRPEVLVDLAQSVNAGTVIVDSLKDAAVKLTDDESGGNINRAFQMLLAEGHDLGVLHHQRKGSADQSKAPKGIDDIYGSALITAGMGSVLALHGQPGDPVVDLLHLKQPMENCGPIRVEHDDRSGLTSVAAKFDPLAFLRRRSNGATAKEAAIAKFDKQTPTEAEVVRARRELDRLVRTMPGQVVRDDPQLGGDGGSKGARYRWVDGIEHLDSPPTPPPTRGFAA